MKKEKKIRTKKDKAKLLHQYYSYTGFYKFVWSSLRKAIIPILGIIVIIFLFNEYVYNINKGLAVVTEELSTTGVLITFFISETLLGLIPPEIFIAWSKKTADPILNLFLLSLLSYSGGLIGYHLGKLTLKIESVKNFLEVKMAKHLKNTGKWGGFLIIVGALLPVPFSITCIAAGIIGYKFKNVMLFGLFRFLRFALYAWAIFNVVS